MVSLELHEKQRLLNSLQNPTFGPAAIKALVPVFLSKSFQVRFPPWLHFHLSLTPP